MKALWIAGATIAGALLGITLGVALSATTIRRLRRRVRELKAGIGGTGLLQSVTRFLFVTTQIFALGWVSASYGIAAYSTVKLMQPFPVEELSRQAIITLLGVSALKVAENIFEHNEGPLFGRSRGTEAAQEESTEEAEG